MRTNSKMRFEVVLVVLGALFLAVGPGAAETRSAPSEIVISYKLDAALTRSLYMGDRWVTRARYASTVQTGDEAVVEIRAVGKRSTGLTVSVNPRWKISDGCNAAVSPELGSEVRITAAQPGQCELTVSVGTVTRALLIEVAIKNGGWQAVVTQRP